MNAYIATDPVIVSLAMDLGEWVGVGMSPFIQFNTGINILDLEQVVV